MNRPGSLFLATTNQGKVREVTSILEPFGFQVETLAQRAGLKDLEVEETAATFAGNALLKASAYADHTGVPTIADDSGLVVDALGGRPGIYSARYAGHHADDEANNRKLISRLSGVAQDERTARFVCALVLFIPQEAGLGSSPLKDLFDGAIQGELEHVDEGVPVFCQGGVALQWSGQVEGIIVDEPRGKGGFGYDPHFFLPDLGKTTAELTPEKKNQLSHRGKAVRRMAQSLALYSP